MSLLLNDSLKFDVLLQVFGCMLRTEDAQLLFHSAILFHMLSYICFFLDNFIKDSAEHNIRYSVSDTDNAPLNAN